MLAQMNDPAEELDVAAILNKPNAKAKVKHAGYLVADAKARLRRHAKGKRTYLPWPKVNPYFEFGRDEVTVWAGQNGHGKTDATTQVALSLVGLD